MKKISIIVILLFCLLGCSKSDNQSSSNGSGSLAFAERAGGNEGRGILRAAKSGSRIDLEEGKGIATFSDGTFVISGRFMGTATFGAGDLNETILSSSGSDDIFVAKYNADGSLAFAKRAGGSGVDRANATASTEGGFFITGYYSGTAIFGAGEIHESTLISSGSDDMFVAGYSIDGTLVFAKSAGGIGVDEGLSIAAQNDGTCFVTGRYNSSAVFGPGEINETTLVGGRIFVAKYHADGTLDFAKKVSGSGNNNSFGIVAQDNGTFFVTGRFSGEVVFGPGEVNETTLFATFGPQAFIAKYNTDGTLALVKQAGGEGWCTGRAMSLAGENIFITGDFTGTATFGTGEVNETTLVLDNANASDVFVAKYNIDGTLVFAKRTSGFSSHDNGFGISALSDGTFFIAGQFKKTVIFGPGEVGQTALTSYGGVDIFVAKYNPDGTLDFVNKAGGSGTDTGAAISTTSDGGAVLTGYFSGSAIYGEGEAGETNLVAEGFFDIFVAKYN